MSREDASQLPSLTCVFALVWLFLHSASADVENRTFTTCQTATASTTFRRCTFRSFGSSNEGGALYLNTGTATLGIAAYAFWDCFSSERGSAIHSRFCLAFSMNDTIGSSYSCQQYNSFGCVSGSAGGALIVVRSSVVFGDCSDGTLWIAGNRGTGSPVTSIVSLDSSVNSARDHGSGLSLGWASLVDIHFCLLSGNTEANCLLSEFDIKRANVSCLGMSNNSCESVSDHSGLVCVFSPLAMSHCPFSQIRLITSSEPIMGHTASRSRGVYLMASL
jgi:hypothetical protein